MRRNPLLFRFFPLVFVSVLLASCATTSKIETNKNAAYSDFLTKLYIVMDIGDWVISRDTSSDPKKATLKDFRLDESLISSLEKKFQDRGITTKSNFVTELDTNPEQIAKDRTDFSADREMMVKLSGGKTLDGKHLLKGIFDARILDTSDQSAEHYPIVWRAKVTAEGGQVYVGAFIPLPVNPEKVVDSIITGLQTDGLIAAQPAKAN